MRPSISPVLASLVLLAACEAEPLPPSDGGGERCTHDHECTALACPGEIGQCTIDGYCIYSARGCDSGVPSGPDAAALCGAPSAYTDTSVTIPVDLADPAWRQTDCTAAPCSPDAGTACCNHCTVRYVIPCASMRIDIRAAPGLGLPETDFGPYEPSVTWQGTGLPGTIRLGCLGCESGVSCSPEDPAAVSTLTGRMIAPVAPSTTWVFEVDALAP